MISIGDNDFGMRIGNSTIYHTGDVIEIFRSVTAHLEEDHWIHDSIRLFKIKYFNQHYKTSDVNYLDHSGSLYLSLPRKSSLNFEPSALTSLAGALEATERTDDGYIYYATSGVIDSAIDELSMVLGLTKEESADISRAGLRLRYCGRLTKQQRELQDLAVTELEFEYLLNKKQRVEQHVANLVAAYDTKIAAARAELEKHCPVA